MNIGDKVPEILGLNEKGEEIRLSDYKGKKIVLYFYPKDMTSGVLPRHVTCVIIMRNCAPMVMK